MESIQLSLTGIDRSNCVRSICRAWNALEKIVLLQETNSKRTMWGIVQVLIATMDGIVFIYTFIRSVLDVSSSLFQQQKHQSLNTFSFHRRRNPKKEIVYFVVGNPRDSSAAHRKLLFSLYYDIGGLLFDGGRYKYA